jgi:hypothetical protein
LNSEPTMHPFFIAFGPRFKQNFTRDTFNIVDIYPLMCSVLEIEPAANNGSFSNVSPLLFNSSIDSKTDMKADNYVNSNKCTLETDFVAAGSGAPSSFGSVLFQMFKACNFFYPDSI